MHKQIQIAPGIFMTDYSKQKDLGQKRQLTNDVGLLLDQVQCLEEEISLMQYSIKEIQNQENWQQDADFVSAIQENWKYIVKFSHQMKERVLKLFQLHYFPQSEIIQDLLKITRIEERQQKAAEHVKQGILQSTNKVQNEKEGLQQRAVAANNDEDSEKGNKMQMKQQQIQQDQEEEEDKGVYI